MKTRNTEIKKHPYTSEIPGSKKGMPDGQVNYRWQLPNMILIAGDGRNVGKTTFARQLIQHLSKTAEVTALKTSPHIHALTDDLNILYRTANYIVAEEKGMNKKDSSLFLQAGAKKVFFIMAKQEYLEQAFSLIAEQLRQKIVISESGGLNEFIHAGIFFFVRNKDGQVDKTQYLKYNPYQVMNGKEGFDFDIERLCFIDNNIGVK